MSIGPTVVWGAFQVYRFPGLELFHVMVACIDFFQATCTRGAQALPGTPSTGRNLTGLTAVHRKPP
eukprot:2905140-Lingulodinium_polyedra.AAC.1